MRMFSRFLTLLGEIVFFCVLMFAGGLFWASHYVDTDGFRERFTEVLEGVAGVPVVLHGELNIAVYPKLSLEILDLAVGSSGDEIPLVRIDSILVSAKLIPLLSRQLNLRTVVIEGMDINVVQSPEGELNWQPVVDRWTGKEAAAVDENPFEEISINGVDVVDATVVYAGNTETESFELSGVNIRTGVIIPGQDIAFSANSDFSWENGLVESSLALKGGVGVEEGHLQLQDATVYASIGGEFLPKGANPGELVGRLVVDSRTQTVSMEGLRARFLGVRADGQLKTGDLRHGLNAKGYLTVHSFTPSTLVKRFFPTVPVASVDGLNKSNCSFLFDVSESGVVLNKLSVLLDDLTVRGSVEMKGYAHPRFSFRLRSGMIDLDRYLPLFKTDTPFVWGDYPLAFFRWLKGAGEVQAEGFKVLDIPLSGVQVSMNSKGKNLHFNAKATSSEDGPITGTLDCLWGYDKRLNAPTLGLATKWTVESSENGFAFLKGDSLELTGKSVLQAHVETKSMTCQPRERSINVLKYLSGNMSLEMDAGKGRYVKSPDSVFPVTWSKAGLNVRFSPVATEKKDNFIFNISSNLQGKGAQRFDSFSLSVQGPVRFGVDKSFLNISNMKVKSHVAGPLYTKAASRLAAEGVVGFDSVAKRVSVESALVKTLEASVKGNANISWTDKDFKVSGRVDAPDVNVRRIIYLLSGVTLDPNDPDALKSASLSADYVLNPDGFTLSGLRGNLDGMDISGHVVGQGLWNPMCSFSFAAGKLDIDRYLPRSPEPSLEEQRAGKVYDAPPVDLPLTFLRMLRLNGKGRFEEFKLAKIRAQSVTAELKADNGDIRVKNIVGVVNRGALNGKLTGQVSAERLRTQLKLHVEDMAAGPFMTEIAKRDYVRGEADLDFDVTSFGVTDEDIVANLAGQASVKIKDGSYKFTGYDDAPSHLSNGSATSSIEPRKRRTAFSRSEGLFSIRKGVFTADKLRMEAPPVLQSYGTGNFSLPGDSINLSIKNDFVAVPSVTINITGRLTDPKVNIPKGKILSDTVRNVLSLPEKSFEFLRDLFRMN